MTRFVIAAAVVVLVSTVRADDRTDELFAAARKGDAKTVAALLDKGVDVNSKTAYGATALHYASDKGHVEVVKLLLERKANPNLADTFYGATPITWASMNDRAAIIGELLKAGATGGSGLLRPAASSGKADVVKAILDNSKPTPEQLTGAWKWFSRKVGERFGASAIWFLSDLLHAASNTR